MDTSTEYVAPAATAESSQLTIETFGTQRSTDKIRQVVDRLLQVIRSFESFATEQLDQLEDASRQRPPGTAEPVGDVPEDFAQSVKQFMELRSRWEEERQHQVAQIQQDTAQLAEAWQRLETEQRSFISERRRDVRPAPEQRTVVMSTQPVHEPIVEPASTEASGQSRSSESMMLQYEQLRREVRKHSRRRK